MPLIQIADVYQVLEFDRHLVRARGRGRAYEYTYSINADAFDARFGGPALAARVGGTLATFVYGLYWRLHSLVTNHVGEVRDQDNAPGWAVVRAGNRLRPLDDDELARELGVPRELWLTAARELIGLRKLARHTFHLRVPDDSGLQAEQGYAGAAPLFAAAGIDEQTFLAACLGPGTRSTNQHQPAAQAAGPSPAERSGGAIHTWPTRPEAGPDGPGSSSTAERDFAATAGTRPAATWLDPAAATSTAAATGRAGRLSNEQADSERADALGRALEQACRSGQLRDAQRLFGELLGQRLAAGLPSGEQRRARRAIGGVFAGIWSRELPEGERAAALRAWRAGHAAHKALELAGDDAVRSPIAAWLAWAGKQGWRENAQEDDVGATKASPKLSRGGER